VTETIEARVRGAIAEGRQFRAQSLARQAGIPREKLAAWFLEDLSGKVVAYQQAGDPRNALRLYSQAIRLGVPNYEARKAGALCLYQMGEYRDAAEALSLLAKEKYDREVEEVLKQSIEQSSGAGGEAHLRWKGAGGIGNLIERCPLVLLLKRIRGATNP
jgi:tetratricopeptide (TPR) repeat protein